MVQHVLGFAKKGRSEKGWDLLYRETTKGCQEDSCELVLSAFSGVPHNDRFVL